MPRSKRKMSKKRRKKSPQKKEGDALSISPLDDGLDSFQDGHRAADLYQDNIALYEASKGAPVDPLNRIEGIGYETEEFRGRYPHIAEELGDSDLIYPIDEVRWDDQKESAEEDISRPEEPTVESLLRRSRTPEEATEIINYLEKRGELSPAEAKKLLKILNTRGLKAFK
jgi:hypothetical protein